MANNFKKVVLFSTLAGIAAAGTYYLLQKKDVEKEEDLEEDFEFFDDDEVDVKPKRSYVSIDLDNAKEIVSENVLKAIDKTKELISDFDVPKKLDKAKVFVEELSFAKEAKTEEAPEYTTVYEAAKDEEAKTEAEEDFDEDETESEDFDFSDEE